jgi:hypothetical protein
MLVDHDAANDREALTGPTADLLGIRTLRMYAGGSTSCRSHVTIMSTGLRGCGRNPDCPRTGSFGDRGLPTSTLFRSVVVYWNTNIVEKPLNHITCWESAQQFLLAEVHGSDLRRVTHVLHLIADRADSLVLTIDVRLSGT